MDRRLQQLSYSSLLTLHSCPRKYQLYKLQTQVDVEDDEIQSVTFAFGHAVGAGIQTYIRTQSFETALWDMFLAWDADFLAQDIKGKKDFPLAVYALEKFIHLNPLQDYELLHYKDVPAVELSYMLHLPGGFRLRGFMDVVLRHKRTGAILVLELKTTKSKDPAIESYANSAQAVGYSVILDAVVPGLSSYDVLYLVYSSTSFEYTPMQFTKTVLKRAEWLQDVLCDLEIIKMYDSVGVFPTRGESCFSFFRPCAYFGTCTLSTALMTSPEPPDIEAKLLEEESKYLIHVSFEDLLDAQLTRTST